MKVLSRLWIVVLFVLGVYLLLQTPTRKAHAIAGSALDNSSSVTTAAQITLAGDVTGAGNANAVVGIHTEKKTPTIVTITDASSTIPITTSFMEIDTTPGTTTTLAAPNISVASVTDGQHIVILNNASDDVVFTADSQCGGGTATHFCFPGLSTFTLSQGRQISLTYRASPGPAVWVVDGVPTNFTLPVALGGTGTTSPTGKCTLNGGTPSTCTASVKAASFCVCSPVGATAVIAAAGCAVGLSSTTLTITSAAAAAYDVNYHCF